MVQIVTWSRCAMYFPSECEFLTFDLAQKNRDPFRHRCSNTRSTAVKKKKEESPSTTTTKKKRETLPTTTNAHKLMTVTIILLSY